MLHAERPTETPTDTSPLDAEALVQVLEATLEDLEGLTSVAVAFADQCLTVMVQGPVDFADVGTLLDRIVPPELPVSLSVTRDRQA